MPREGRAERESKEDYNSPSINHIGIYENHKKGDRPRWPVAGARQAAIASGVTRTVKLPRSCNAWSYSRQFFPRHRAFGNWWRRAALPG